MMKKESRNVPAVLHFLKCWYNLYDFTQEHMAGHAGFTDIPDDNELFVLETHRL